MIYMGLLLCVRVDERKTLTVYYNMIQLLFCHLIHTFNQRRLYNRCISYSCHNKYFCIICFSDILSSDIIINNVITINI